MTMTAQKQCQLAAAVGGARARRVRTDAVRQKLHTALAYSMARVCMRRIGAGPLIADGMLIAKIAAAAAQALPRELPMFPQGLQ